MNTRVRTSRLVARPGQGRFGIVGFLAATLLVLAALVIFARYPAIFRHGREYRAVFRNVAGLNPGDDVRYGGLPVGTVTRIELSKIDPTRLVIYFRVGAEAPVRVDTRAAITQVGLLGEPFLNLEPGRADAPPLAPGGIVPSIANMSFQDAMTRLAIFFDRADTLLSGAERMANASPLEHANRTLDRMDTLMVTVTRGSDRVFTNLDSTTTRIDALMARSQRLVVQLDTAVRHSAPELRSAEREALETVRDVHSMLTDLHDALQQGGGVGELVQNMSVTAQNLARLTDRLDRDPASVLKRREVPVKSVGPKVRE